MAFKSKLKIEQLKELTQVEYTKLIKKEVARASKFGEAGVVILSDYQFKCGSVGTMMILDKMSGPLIKYYKQLKKDRSKEKDFAKGTCYFEENEGGSKMNIALDDGKGKPARMKKNGKSLFKKLGFNTEIFKGDVVLNQDELEELEDIKEEVDEENDDQKIKKIIRKYKKAFALVVKKVVPLLKGNPTGDGVTEKHYQAVYQLLRLSKSIQDRYDEVKNSLKKKDDIEAFVNDVANREGNIMKMASKLKKLLQAKTGGDLDDEENTDQDSRGDKIPLSDERRSEIEAQLASIKERLDAISA